MPGVSRNPASYRTMNIGSYLKQTGWQKHASCHPAFQSWQHRCAGILLPLRNTHPDTERLETIALLVLARVERCSVDEIRRRIGGVL